MGKSLGFYTTAEEALQGADLTGKQAIVTGGNSGIGVETVRVLASAGADVVLCSRNVEAGQKVADSIAASLAQRSGASPAPGRITVAPLDLADLRSVQAFVDHPAVADLPAVHLLVLNAGIMALPKLQRTKQGFEAQWGTNHVGHQYLTQLLLPKIKAQGSPARVVVLSSYGHNFAKDMPLDDLNWQRRKYIPFPAYGQSKLSNALMARELARRMAKEGVPIKAYSLHPGMINTPLSRSMNGGAALRRVMSALMAFKPLAGWVGLKTVEQGAATTIYACVAPELEQHSGAYLADCQLGSAAMGWWGRKFNRPSALCTDDELARRLWDKTEEMIAAALQA